MPSFDSVSRADVLTALTEYDERGADTFLALYGFGRAREYLLWHEGRSYDSKAVLGVAYRQATGSRASSADFSGAKTGAAKVLRDLGFEVTAAGQEPAAAAPTTGEWREAADVGQDESRDAWAEAARVVLLEAASRYGAVVTYKELATQVQAETGIRTKQLMHYWIGDVLARVAAQSSSLEEPLLSALCVNADGSVGESYAVAVRAASGDEPTDPDDHAARERLACYQHFGATGLPDDGGAPALTAKLAASRGRARKIALEARPIATCPTCYMALPATGICDECG